jgi:hypothetical protein
MHDTPMMEGMREAGHRGTPMASVSVPDLLAYVISLAIVIFIWVQ